MNKNEYELKKVANLTVLGAFAFLGTVLAASYIVAWKLKRED